MLYLVAFFLSPLAVLLAGKPFQAILNALLYVLAWLGLFIFFIPGVVCWFLGVFHACLVINARNADRRADRIAAAMRPDRR